MAATAPVTQYREEAIAAFEQGESLLRQTVVTEAQIKGNTAVFLVAGSGGASATSRGANGLITARNDSNTQNSCTLSEWHDLVRKTNFNIFESQADQRAVMYDSTMKVINRKLDSQIETVLNGATVSIGSGAGTIPNPSLFWNGVVKLQNAGVPWDGMITLLCQPSFLAYLQQATEFASADYVSTMPYSGENTPLWSDRPMVYVWNNVKVIAHPNLSGRGTSSEYSYVYHKNSVGHAMDTKGIDHVMGYNEEQNYSYARATGFMGAKGLQSSGYVSIVHDGSAYA